MKKIFILLLLTALFTSSWSQNFSCGTNMQHPAYLALINSSTNKTSSIDANIDQCLHKTVSIFVHIVLDSLGQANIAKQDIDSTVARVNRAFAPICLSFKICKTDTIVNWKYDSFHAAQEEKEILTLYYTPKVVNWLFVQKIENPGGANGYAYPPGGPDLVVMQKKAATEFKAKTAIHEMGHFFGLYHTHEPIPTEHVDRINCLNEGDLLCDTEADPYPLGKVNAVCQYSGAKDGGKWYIPPVDNYMSYWPDYCACRFTTDQYNRMAAQLLNFRNYLW